MLQMGFGFEITDKEGNTPPFLYKKADVQAAMDVIQGAFWASVDMEGTGLTDASDQVNLDKKQLKADASADVRMRTIQVRVPLTGRGGERVNYAFDLDRMKPGQVEALANMVLSRPLFIAHNAGFDLYWLRRAGMRKVMPKMVLDTMLLTRLLDPKHVMARGALLEDIETSDDLARATPAQKAAWKSLVGEASGTSLADVVLAYWGVVLDKTYQKPQNWTGLLGFAHYDYAVDDVIWADRIACKLLGLDDDGDIYRAYLWHRANNARVRLLEPQVPELVELREHGMPINPSIGRRFADLKATEIRVRVAELIDIEPTLAPFRDTLADPDAGRSANLTKALATAFTSRGVALRYTAATAVAQVGEKDLRACRAAQNPESKPLFDAWVGLCRAKKTRSMALEVVGFSQRSEDGRIRALLSHGPITGRLAAAEPNCQQWPRDQIFRAMCMSDILPGCATLTLTADETTAPFFGKVAGRPVAPGEVVELDTAWLATMFVVDKLVAAWPDALKLSFGAILKAQFSHTIVASDFGALDVRVGAALAIRAQREILAIAQGTARAPAQLPEEVLDQIHEIGRTLKSSDPAAVLREKSVRWQASLDNVSAMRKKLEADYQSGDLTRKQYFKESGRLRSQDKLLRFSLRWAQCLLQAIPRGSMEYSALRDAFVADIDIHTFTGMKLVGRDPMKEFDGLSLPDRKALEKKLKKELGPRRQQGKIANLSLLYGMADAGFQEAAARGYDEHWTMEEAHDIRALWMDAYPEVELWHLWTEYQQLGVVYQPDSTSSSKKKRKGWWMATTLAGREIVALGLNAALSYQDQSTGADILGMIMHELKQSHAPIFDCAINQVHDEVVFAFPVDHDDEYLATVEAVMVGEANKLTMPYGVPCAVSPACGQIWIKD